MRRRLEAGVVEVWRVALDAGPEAERAAWASLSPDERERARRFAFDRDRRRFVAARGAARALLGAYMGLAPEAVRFSYGPQGKPALEGDGAPRFNVSHSGEVAVLAVAREMEVGVDVELMREEVATLEIAERFFSRAERDALARVAPDRRRRAFFEIWTRKEALLKGVGGGLFLRLDGFDVSCDPDAPTLLVASRDPAVDRTIWTLASLPAPEGYAAALAVAARGRSFEVRGPRLWRP